MLISLHKQATTTPNIRAAIQASDEPAWLVAERYGISEQTVWKWRKRDSVLDRSHTPHRLQTTLTPAQEAVAVVLRQALLLPLDGLMRGTDIFLAPSLHESFGLIYVEAMRYSVPSVAYAAGGVPEVVTDGEDGLLAPLGDTRALHAALRRLIDDADLRRRLSRGARHSFEKKFGADLMVERLEDVYRGVAAGKKRAA